METAQLLFAQMFAALALAVGATVDEIDPMLTVMQTWSTTGTPETVARQAIEALRIVREGGAPPGS